MTSLPIEKSPELSGPVLVPEENKRPLLDHLEELRSRLLRSFFWVAAGVLFSWGRVPVLLSLFLQPIGHAVFFSPSEPFLVHFKMAMVAGVAMAFPFIAWETWSFLRPAAYPYERRLFFFFLPMSVLLFFFGGWFGWKILLPAALAFLLRFGSDSLTPMISIGGYMSFAGWLVLGSALVFETPMAILFLAWRKLVSAKTLLSQWRMAIVAILIIAAVLTPTPDVVTQLLLALPMAGLYFLSIGLAFLVNGERVKRVEP